ncbi:hypothetical protein B0H13DRAFT_2400825 [Mycena leptocephala]|nr:hypothetical protein B0H13DRAFT_2400825 [Mycena leptocephala]
MRECAVSVSILFSTSIPVDIKIWSRLLYLPPPPSASPTPAMSRCVNARAIAVAIEGCPGRRKVVIREGGEEGGAAADCDKQENEWDTRHLKLNTEVRPRGEPNNTQEAGIQARRGRPQQQLRFSSAYSARATAWTRRGRGGEIVIGSTAQRGAVRRTENAERNGLTSSRELRRNSDVVGCKAPGSLRHSRGYRNGDLGTLNDPSARLKRREGSKEQLGQRDVQILHVVHYCPSTPSKSTKPIIREVVVYIVKRSRDRGVQGFHAWNGGGKNGKGRRYAAPEIFATAANYQTIEVGGWSSERGGKYE